MRSVEEKTPSVAGLLSPDGSPRIDITKSLRKKRDPASIRQGLMKNSLDGRLDYAPISLVSPTGSIVSSRSPTGSTKDGEFDEGTALKETQNEPIVFYNNHAKEGDMSFSDSARVERPLRKKPTALVVEDVENFTFQNSKEQVKKEEEILENEPLDDRESIRLKMKQERLAREQQRNNNYIVTIEEAPKEDIVAEEPQRKKKKKHKKSEEIIEPDVVENKSRKLKEIQEIGEEDEQSKIVDNVGIKGVRRMLQQRRKESHNEEEQKVIQETPEKVESLVHETRPKKHSKSSKSKHKKSEEQHEDKGRSSENLDQPTQNLKLSKASSQESVKNGEKKNQGSNLRKMVMQRQASQTLHEHPSPLLTGDSMITGTYGFSGNGGSALLTNDHPLLIKGTTPESMNFTTAVSMITTSRKRDSVIVDGKEIKEKISSKEKKKHKHHHHHHRKDHDKEGKSKKSSSSSKKKRHRGEHSEDNVPLSSDFKQHEEGGGASEIQSKSEITPVIRPALLTDGLDLVKLMLDRRNRKKSKLIIVLFTLLVVLTLILNGLEMAKFNSTSCEGQTYEGVIYASFAIMIILKIFCISLFNLELTYKQSYDPLARMLYPFLAYFLCPLLQLPQNVYNFNTCIETNKVINMKQSWSYVGGILGSLAISFLYFGIRKSVKRASTQVSVLARACAGVSNIIKFLMILSLIAWNVIVFVLFGGQKVFMLSLFFDFLVYLILGFSVIAFLIMNHKWTENVVADSFVKIESEEVQIARAAEKLNRNHEGGEAVEIVVRDEQGKEVRNINEEKHELDDIKIQVH